MRNRLITGLTTAACVTGFAVVASAGSAAASALDPLYVNKTAAGCSDTGPGTQAQPYCKISAALAAVSPGQTVYITGIYTEHVTIAKSGNAGQPITLKNQGGSAARLIGANAGFTVDGQHDIVISGFSVENNLNAPGVALSNSTRITVESVEVYTANTATVLGFQLTAVTDSSLVKARASGQNMTMGISLDAATARVVVKSPGGGLSQVTGGKTIDVWGSDNAIVNGSFNGGSVAAIVLEPGAAGNVVANNYLGLGYGDGIYNNGATGTAITNNTVQQNCGTGIRVAGASSGVSVQNNVADDNGSLPNCDPAVPGVGIGVYDDAVNDTVVDYNTVRQLHGQPRYAWKTPMDLPAFQAASGQGAHDSTSNSWLEIDDSANSTAPGYQSTDGIGNPREDNPDATNIGAGPVTYADRGRSERVKPPFAQLALTPDHKAVSITADASGSTPGWEPITSYTLDFGDGTTVTQSTPVATHRYAQPGTYTVTVYVVDAKGMSSSGIKAEWSLWPAVRSIALLSGSDGHYVTAGAAGAQPLVANRAAVGPWELFDLVDTGDGLVALRARANGQYVSVQSVGGPNLLAVGDTTGPWALFKLVNNVDGTVSLQSNRNNQYVSGNHGSGPLTADRAAIGAWEKFSLVDAANTSVSLRAHANGRYVVAESAGGQPLIANRTAVGLWEQFDLVDAGDGYVALLSHANGRFVTAEAAGDQPLVANRTAVGPWEKFRVVNNADGSISLQAYANGRYVVAESAGARSLIANRTAIGPWEKFSR